MFGEGELFAESRNYGKEVFVLPFFVSRNGNTLRFSIEVCRSSQSAPSRVGSIKNGSSLAIILMQGSE